VKIYPFDVSSPEEEDDFDDEEEAAIQAEMARIFLVLLEGWVQSSNK
jgi:hypothetical protein